jgi:hypothetical protein
MMARFSFGYDVDALHGLHSWYEYLAFQRLTTCICAASPVSAKHIPPFLHIPKTLRIPNSQSQLPLQHPPIPIIRQIQLPKTRATTRQTMRRPRNLNNVKSNTLITRDKHAIRRSYELEKMA